MKSHIKQACLACLFTCLFALPSFAYDPNQGWYDEQGLTQFSVRQEQDEAGVERVIPSAGSQCHHQYRFSVDGELRAGAPMSWHGPSGEYVIFNTMFPQTVGQIETRLKYIRLAMRENWKPHELAIEVTTDTDYNTESWDRALTFTTEERVDTSYQTFRIPGRSVPFTFIRIVKLSDDRADIVEIDFFGDVIEDATARTFVHPGALVSAASLKSLNTLVANSSQPNARAWQDFQKDPYAAKSFRANPCVQIKWQSTQTDKRQTFLKNDMKAAYFQAIMWHMTGDVAYAENAVEILREWESTLKAVSGKVSLSAMAATFHLSQAVEILKYTYSEWDPGCEAAILNMFETKVLPHAEARFYADNNWTSQHNAALVALAVARNDRYQFNRAIDRMKGIIDTITEIGYVREIVDRDWNHALMHHSFIIAGAEVAFNQGVDVYSYLDSRIGVMINLFSYINLDGGDPKIATYPDLGGRVFWQDGSTILPASHGMFAWGWEVGWNHYNNRMQAASRYPKLLEMMTDVRAQGIVDGKGHLLNYSSLTHAGTGIPLD